MGRHQVAALSSSVVGRGPQFSYFDGLGDVVISVLLLAEGGRDVVVAWNSGSLNGLTSCTGWRTTNRDHHHIAVLVHGCVGVGHLLILSYAARCHVAALRQRGPSSGPAVAQCSAVRASRVSNDLGSC